MNSKENNYKDNFKINKEFQEFEEQVKINLMGINKEGHNALLEFVEKNKREEFNDKKETELFKLLNLDKDSIENIKNGIDIFVGQKGYVRQKKLGNNRLTNLGNEQERQAALKEAKDIVKQTIFDSITNLVNASEENLDLKSVKAVKDNYKDFMLKNLKANIKLDTYDKDEVKLLDSTINSIKKYYNETKVEEAVQAAMEGNPSDAPGAMQYICGAAGGLGGAALGTVLAGPVGTVAAGAGGLLAGQAAGKSIDGWLKKAIKKFSYGERDLTPEEEKSLASLMEAGIFGKGIKELSNKLVKDFFRRDVMYESMLKDFKENNTAKTAKLKEHFLNKVKKEHPELSGEALNQKQKSELDALVDQEIDNFIRAAVDAEFVLRINESFQEFYVQISENREQIVKDKKWEEDNPIMAFFTTTITSIKGVFSENVAQEERAKKDSINKSSESLTVDFLGMVSRDLQLKAKEKKPEIEEPNIFTKVKLAARAMSVGGLIGAASGVWVAFLVGAIFATPVGLVLIAAFSLAGLAFGAVIGYRRAEQRRLAKSEQEREFKRNQPNRDSLEKIATKVASEHNRLEKLIKNVTPTDQKDIDELAEFGASLKKNHKGILVGHWEVEYASRFQSGNPTIEVYLLNKIDEINSYKDNQINHLKKLISEALLLLANNGTDNYQIKIKEIKAYIEKTINYLENSEHKDFIDKYLIKEKIKDQILGLYNTANTEDSKKLIKILFGNFYVKYLNGSENDLGSNLYNAPDATRVQLRNLYRSYKTEKSTVKDAFIIGGNPNNPNEFDLSKFGKHTGFINGKNITECLERSNRFRLSLLGEEIKNPPPDSFLLYSGLLLKECATIANTATNQNLKDKVENFVANNYGIEKSKVRTVLRNIFAEQFIYKKDPDKDPVEELNIQFARNIKTSMAYSPQLTNKTIVNAALNEHAENTGKAKIFSLDKKNLPVLMSGGDPSSYRSDIEDWCKDTKELVNSFCEKTNLTPVEKKAYIIFLNDINAALEANIKTTTEYMAKNYPEKKLIAQNEDDDEDRANLQNSLEALKLLEESTGEVITKLQPAAVANKMSLFKEAMQEARRQEESKENLDNHENHGKRLFY